MAHQSLIPIQPYGPYEMEGGQKKKQTKLEILVYYLFTYQFTIFTAQWISLPVTEERQCGHSPPCTLIDWQSSLSAQNGSGWSKILMNSHSLEFRASYL